MDVQELEVWYTKLSFDGQGSLTFMKLPSVKVSSFSDGRGFFPTFTKLPAIRVVFTAFPRAVSWCVGAAMFRLDFTELPYAFLLSCLVCTGSIIRKTGRLAHTTVKDIPMFNVEGQQKLRIGQNNRSPLPNACSMREWSHVFLPNYPHCSVS